jgi:protein arginine kinase
MLFDGPVLHRTSPGPHADFDVVVRSRVSLSRNLKDTPFPWRLDADRLAALGVRLAGALEVSGFRVTDIGKLDGALRSVLADRDLYPRPYLMDESRMAAVHPVLPAWALVNEKEHLSLHAELPGSDLGKAWESLSSIDDALSTILPWAFEVGTGFLFSEARRCGTGLLAVATLHLPALVSAGLADLALRKAMEQGILAGGSYAASTASAAHLFTLTLESPPHESEWATVERLLATVTTMAEYERRVRTDILANSPWEILDICGRALGRAGGAWMVSWDETAEIVSGLRLGASLGIILGMSLEEISDLWVSLKMYRSAFTSREDEPEAQRRARHLRKATRSLYLNEEYFDV